MHMSGRCPKSSGFWDITPCNWFKVNLYFRGTCLMVVPLPPGENPFADKINILSIYRIEE
jgi:hypothetical protein